MRVFCVVLLTPLFFTQMALAYVYNDHLPSNVSNTSSKTSSKHVNGLDQPSVVMPKIATESKPVVNKNNIKVNTTSEPASTSKLPTNIDDNKIMDPVHIEVRSTEIVNDNGNSKEALRVTQHTDGTFTYEETDYFGDESVICNKNAPMAETIFDERQFNDILDHISNTANFGVVGCGVGGLAGLGLGSVATLIPGCLIGAGGGLLSSLGHNSDLKLVNDGLPAEITKLSFSKWDFNTLMTAVYEHCDR